MDRFRQAPFGRRQLVQGYVVLVRQTAPPIALPAPSLIFVERLFGVVSLQFGDQADDVVIEFRLGEGQGGIAAYQQAGGGVGRQAIEIGIDQDGGPLLGFLQQAGLGGRDILARDGLLSKGAAARIAISDPFRVFRDRPPPVGEPVKSVFDGLAQPCGGGVEFGIAEEKLFGGLTDGAAMIAVKQRQRPADRPVAVCGSLGGGGIRQSNLDRNDGQHNSPHPNLRPTRNNDVSHASLSDIGMKWNYGPARERAECGRGAEPWSCDLKIGCAPASGVAGRGTRTRGSRIASWPPG